MRKRFENNFKIVVFAIHSLTNF